MLFASLLAIGALDGLTDVAQNSQAGSPAWKYSDSVGFDGCVLIVDFTNEPGWPSARAVVYVGPFELPRSW